MKYNLNIQQRFDLVNQIGELLSTKDNFKKSVLLIEKLAISKEEAEDPNLGLSYDEATSKFTYNTSFDKIICVDESELPDGLVGINA